jgi:cytochrome P450
VRFSKSAGRCGRGVDRLQSRNSNRDSSELMSAPSSPDPISFADPQIASCPFSAYRKLQESSQPVYFDASTGIYEVVGAAEIRAAATDVKTFSNMSDRQALRGGELQGQIRDLYEREGYPPIPTLLNNDGEGHRRYRSLVDRAFTVARINALLPAIRAEVDTLMTACGASPEFDFIQKFAIPLPLNIICDQLIAAREDHPVFKAGSDAMLVVADPLTPADKMLDYVRDIIAMQHILAHRVERVRQKPDDTIFSIVANSEVDGELLTTSMMVNLFQNILVAGNETTTNALGNALQLLIEDASLRERLRADESGAAVRNFVEEALRLRAPLQGFFRVATHDTELGGVKIPAGATVMLRWGAGGRDPALFSCPEELQLERTAITQHMTFGHGAHFCIGNQLARAEMRVAFQAIVTRWPNVRYAGEDAVEPLKVFFAHGPRRLRIRID